MRCTVDVPTVTLGVERSMLNMGASAEKLMSVAPESIMPVACKEDVYGLVVMAGLKLAVLVLCSLDFIKIKLCFLTVSLLSQSASPTWWALVPFFS